MGDEFTQLCSAVREGNVEKASEAYEGCNINRPMAAWDKRSPLHFAIDNSNVEMTEFLLQTCGAEPSYADDKKRNALHHAIQEEHVQIFFKLLEHPIDLMATDQWQNTPLHLAANCINATFARTLVSRSPQALSMLSNDGRTPLHIARMGNIPKIIAILEEAEAVVERPRASAVESAPKVYPLSEPQDRSEDDSNSTSLEELRAELARERQIRQKAEASLQRIQFDRDRLEKQAKLVEGPATAPVAMSEQTLDSSGLNSDIIRVIQHYISEAADMKAAFEASVNSESMDQDDQEDGIIDVDEWLDQDRDLVDETISSHMAALKLFDGVGKLKSEFRAVHAEYPRAKEEVTAACATLETMISEGTVSPVARMPEDMSQLHTMVHKLAVNTLNQLYEGDKSAEIAIAMANSDEIVKRCRTLEQEHEAMQLVESSNSNDAIDALRSAYTAALRSCMDVLILCKKDGARDLQERLPGISDECHTTTLGIRATQEAEHARVQREMDLVDKNAKTAAMAHDSALETLAVQEEELVKFKQKEEAEAARVAMALDAILKQEVERQTRVYSQMKLRRARENRRRMIEREQAMLAMGRKQRYDRLEVLRDVYEKAGKTAKMMRELVNFVVNATTQKCSSRRSATDTNSHKAQQEFASLQAKYESLYKGCLVNVDSLIVQVDEDMVSWTNIEKHTKSRGRSMDQQKFAEMMAGLEEEKGTLHQRRNALVHEHQQQIELVKEAATMFTV